LPGERSLGQRGLRTWPTLRQITRKGSFYASFPGDEHYKIAYYRK